jgi:hypothetical protein
VFTKAKDNELAGCIRHWLTFGPEIRAMHEPCPHPSSVAVEVAGFVGSLGVGDGCYSNLDLQSSLRGITARPLPRLHLTPAATVLTKGTI